jgi:formylglycine-generating enzyme required for sulfatase activity
MNRKTHRRLSQYGLRYGVIAMLFGLSLAAAIPFAGNNALAKSKRKPAPQSRRRPAQKPATPAKRGAQPIQLRSFEFETVTLNSRGEVTNRRKGQARYYVENINGIGLEMVEIPGGSFKMGSSDIGLARQPAHQVNVPSFYIGKYEVTQAQWKAVARLPKVSRDLNPETADFKGDNLPVEEVSWLDAMEFCARLFRATGRVYRLPSEAEWEYACRAGTTTEFAFGETITPEFVNYDGNEPYGKAPKGMERKRTTPIGSLGVANGFGLYDMHGNVSEWCLDTYHSTYEGAPTDGSAWGGKGEGVFVQVARGGDFRYEAERCRSANRDSNKTIAIPPLSLELLQLRRPM